MTAIALTIAGSDSSGGAGIQADLKTFSALGVYGASVLTAITAQNTRGVTAIHDIPEDIIIAQIDAVLSDLNVGAIKTGMLSRPQTIIAVADRLAQAGSIPLIVDPVMVAASGATLLQPEAVSLLREKIFKLALMITPNLPEAAVLLDEPIARTPENVQRQGRALLAYGPRYVLIKGGHGDGADSVDFLVSADEMVCLSSPRLATLNTHGTGCTLASAIAVGLAKKMTVIDAVETAKKYVFQAISAADHLEIGHGHGPVHHFYQTWR